MAEAAPFTTAHAHARQAAHETRHEHWTAAANEHRDAASDFARSARSTGDSEALRVLKLLEQQHRRLAGIIKSTATPETTEAAVDHHVAAEPLSKPSSPPSTSSPVTKHKSTTSALAAARIGSQARDASPSLAREIASRRGIPQTGRSQPSPAAQARARQLSPEASRTARSSHAQKVPPSVVDSQATIARAKQSKRADNDDGFAKFYDSVRTGSMSKLSSVLAYAGLPLTADELKPDRSPSSKALSKQTVSAGSDNVAHKYISKAALAALEAEQRQRGQAPHGLGPAESFYVVPPTGMMTSFADIARRRGLEDDEDDFVDAREAQTGPASPRQSTTQQTGGRRASFGKARTHEELELENGTLKITLEQLTGRLVRFEAHAQDASMAALTQSMASLGGAPPGSSDSDRLQQRLREMEEQAERDEEEKRQMRAQARWHEQELKRWDERYARLAKGAKLKMQARGQGGSGGKGDVDAVQGEARRDGEARE